MKNKNINKIKIQLVESLIKSEKACGRKNLHYENNLSTDEIDFLVMDSSANINKIERINDFDGYPLYIIHF